MRKKILFIILAAFVLLTVAVLVTVRFDLKRGTEGVFLLKGGNGKPLEIKNYLYLGDGPRLMFGIDTDAWPFNLFCSDCPKKVNGSWLEYAWDEGDGYGYVRNMLPGGMQLLTCFSRFVDDQGKVTHGLFLGGGLPASVKDDNIVKMTETGMAFYDGHRWYHLWCTENEGLGSATTTEKTPPTSWEFLGSRVLDRGPQALTVVSMHRATVDGVPLSVNRYAYFKAGRPYFALSINITNAGQRPVSYYYAYGDDPWVGDYGTAKGNVGWVNDRLIEYEEVIDSSKYGYAGIFDYGSDAIGEGHDFTMAANFIQWDVGRRPPLVYFSNSPTECPQGKSARAPLKSNERFIGLQWGPDTLNPGESKSYMLAIGMAELDPKTGFPVKPHVRLEAVP